MQLGATIEDRPANVQPGPDHRREDSIRADDQLPNARFILAAADAFDQQSVRPSAPRTWFSMSSTMRLVDNVRNF
jgi:hypothetical protein